MFDFERLDEFKGQAGFGREGDIPIAGEARAAGARGCADEAADQSAFAASSEAADQSAAARATANQPRGALTLALAGFHRRGGLNIVFLILDGDARQSE